MATSCAILLFSLSGFTTSGSLCTLLVSIFPGLGERRRQLQKAGFRQGCLLTALFWSCRMAPSAFFVPGEEREGRRKSRNREPADSLEHSSRELPSGFVLSQHSIQQVSQTGARPLNPFLLLFLFFHTQTLQSWLPSKFAAFLIFFNSFALVLKEWNVSLKCGHVRPTCSNKQSVRCGCREKKVCSNALRGVRLSSG